MNKPSNQSLRNLDLLVGRWWVEIDHPQANKPISGEASFEWIEDGKFVLYRSGVSGTDFPVGTSIIGPDQELGSYSMLYFDSRNVSRIYQMSLGDGSWKLWRDGPPFAQRFSGKFSQ